MTYIGKEYGGDMLALISESSRYFVGDINAEYSFDYFQSKEETPFGPVRYFCGNMESNEFIYFPDGGMSNKTDAINVPLAIAYVLQSKDVHQLVLIAKVGGINPLLKVGDIVIPDDYIDITIHRKRSYYQALNPSNSLCYVMNNPFCAEHKKNLLCAVKNVSTKFPEVINNIFDTGRYICTEGPAFESSAEISAYRQWGADIVGHTVVPYVYYARELGICFNSICIVSNVCQCYGGNTKGVPMPNSKETISAISDLFVEVVRLPDKQQSCRHISGGVWLKMPRQRSEL